MEVIFATILHALLLQTVYFTSSFAQDSIVARLVLPANLLPSLKDARGADDFKLLALCETALEPLVQNGTTVFPLMS